MEKPGNVNAAGALLLAGGIMTTLVSVGIVVLTSGLWIPWIYGMIAGIYAIVKGAQLLGDGPPGPGGISMGAYGQGVPTAAAVMLIVNVINCDMMSMILGIVALALLNDPATRAWLEGRTQTQGGQGHLGQQQAAGVGYGYGGQQQQAQANPMAQQYGAGQQAPAVSATPGGFVPPQPSAWGPPPQAPAQTAQEKTPSWKAEGWGAKPFVQSPKTPKAAEVSKAAKPKESDEPVWDDMSDWERRFSESTENQPQEEPAEVGAGSWGSWEDKS